MVSKIFWCLLVSLAFHLAYATTANDEAMAKRLATQVQNVHTAGWDTAMWSAAKVDVVISADAATVTTLTIK